MQPDTQMASVYTDMAGISNLKREAATQSDSSKREVAQQFESMFLQLMLKSMRDATPSEGMFGGQEMETYQQMHDQQLALDLSSTGSIGIADLVYRQLGGESDQPIGHRASTSEIQGDHLSMARRLWQGQSNTPLQTSSDYSATKTWNSPDEFVRHLRPAAEQAAERLGTSSEAIIAIAALETGWGSHVAKTQNGQSSFNLFGIKADRSWNQGTTYASTLEFEHGAMQRRQEPFRTYHSASESVADFANFIEQNPRYQAALDNAADPRSFVQELHKAGYATDPRYAEKVNAVMQQLQTGAKALASAADNNG